MCHLQISPDTNTHIEAESRLSIGLICHPPLTHRRAHTLTLTPRDSMEVMWVSSSCSPQWCAVLWLSVGTVFQRWLFDNAVSVYSYNFLSNSFTVLNAVTSAFHYWVRLFYHCRALNWFIGMILNELGSFIFWHDMRSLFDQSYVKHIYYFSFTFLN